MWLSAFPRVHMDVDPLDRIVRGAQEYLVSSVSRTTKPIGKQMICMRNCVPLARAFIAPQDTCSTSFERTNDARRKRPRTAYLHLRNPIGIKRGIHKDERSGKRQRASLILSEKGIPAGVFSGTEGLQVVLCQLESTRQCPEKLVSH